MTSSGTSDLMWHCCQLGGLTLGREGEDPWPIEDKDDSFCICNNKFYMFCHYNSMRNPHLKR